MSALTSMSCHRFSSAVLIVVLGGCSTNQSPVADSSKLAQTGGSIAFADPAAKANLCPLSAAGDPMRGLNDTTISFARNNGFFHWCIPEYHDDQRLHDGIPNSNDYGPIAHIIAWPGLDTLIDEHFDAGYVIVGLIDLENIDPAVPLPNTYVELGLKSTHSCLYLMHHKKFLRPAWFTARIVTPAAGANCAKTVAATDGEGLDVTIEKYSDDKSDYPAVGRFVEGVNGRPLIGIRCTDRWCVVGPKSFGNVPAIAHAGNAGLTKNSRGVVKGWFDDQILGIPDGAPKYKIHRALRASLVPDENLGKYKVSDFINTTKTYKVVGTAFFSEDPPPSSKYVKVFGFAKGENTIGLRAEISVSGTKTDTLWFTQVKNGKGPPKDDIITHRTDHSKWVKAIAATARWRWHDGDEDMWFECDVGCCLANGRAGM